MGFDIIESRTRTARKRHQCDYCGEIIEKGEEYDYQKNIFDGAFYEWHAHPACSHVASAIWDYFDHDDGMSDQDFMDGCHEVCQRFICPDCPEWDKEYGECNKDESYCIDKMDEFFKTHELYKAGREAYYEIWKCRENRRASDGQSGSD